MERGQLVCVRQGGWADLGESEGQRRIMRGNEKLENVEMAMETEMEVMDMIG